MEALNHKRIILAGGTGLVGSHLARVLQRSGAETIILSRHPESAAALPGIRVHPWEELPDLLATCHAIVNLAGEGIASRRWTPARKLALRESRIAPTLALAGALRQSGHRPVVLLNASAIGIYGSAGTEGFDESRPPGAGFLPELCRAWEGAADAIGALGVRVVTLRLGVVLSMEGGALPRMVRPIRLGLGTPLGSGGQGFSWIHHEDLTRLILECLENPAFEGAYNATAPGPCSQGAFLRLLARRLHRPLWPAPALLTRTALRLWLGEMAGPLLLEGAYVLPRKALDLGFVFRFPSAEEAVQGLL